MTFGLFKFQGLGWRNDLAYSALHLLIYTILTNNSKNFKFYSVGSKNILDKKLVLKEIKVPDFSINEFELAKLAVNKELGK